MSRGARSCVDAVVMRPTVTPNIRVIGSYDDNDVVRTERDGLRRASLPPSCAGCLVSLTSRYRLQSSSTTETVTALRGTSERACTKPERWTTNASIPSGESSPRMTIQMRFSVWPGAKTTEPDLDR